MAERIAIILAAGISSRMKTEIPKVLHEVCGRPMLGYVLDACRAVGVSRIYVIVGYGSEHVKQRFTDSDIEWVLQEEQNGTAHAVLCCKELLKDFEGETLVICGDMPLIRAEVLQTLIDRHEKNGSVMTLATAVLDDPTGYGRIERDSGGKLLGIVEHKDCSDEQLKIKEVNPSYYIFDNKIMFETLEKTGNDNAKSEYYITDSISILLGEGKKVEAVTAVSPAEAMGVNSRVDLSEIGMIMQARIQEELMGNGVTIVDPANTCICADVEIGKDTVIEPFTYICQNVKIGTGCKVGPFAYIKEGAVLEDGSVAGPGYGTAV